MANTVNNGAPAQITTEPTPTAIESTQVTLNTDPRSNTVAASISSTTIIYVHTDVLGSVIAESNAAGTVTKTTDYKPFGESKDN